MTTYIYGKNVVISAINSRKVNTIFLLDGFKDKKILDLINKTKISYKYVNNQYFLKNVGNVVHQGIIAEVESFNFVSLDKLVANGKEKKYPLIVILDGINDPHNLGAMLRVADAFNIDGIILKNSNQVSLNPTVAKVSTGAIFYVDVCEVSNLSNAINRLKKEGYWIISSDGKGDKQYDQVDYKMPVALIIGSEGFGISNLILKNSDMVVNIPMSGHVNSLNASNALSVILSHIISNRSF